MSAGNKVLRDIVTDLEAVLNKCGVMYHVFYRTKSEMSIKNKLEKKSEEYRKANKKMQDLLALRITLYFTDDVELVHNYLKSQSNFDSESVDEAEVDKFCPKRLNLIMRVPNNLQQDMKAAIKETGYEDLIDNTYEVQIRTILSEGWHEVEHDLRYKCKEEWNEFKEESRLLNGIYATLERFHGQPPIRHRCTTRLPLPTNAHGSCCQGIFESGRGGCQDCHHSPSIPAYRPVPSGI